MGGETGRLGLGLGDWDWETGIDINMLLLLLLSPSVMSYSATPWTVAHQAPLSMEFSGQEYWRGLPYPPPGDLSNPGVKPRSPALQADTLPLGHQGSPINLQLYMKETTDKNVLYTWGIPLSIL